jgi:N-acetylgalactosamine kinase
MDVPGVVGAQLSGAGLGGCVMVLVRDAGLDELISVLHNTYYAPREAEPATTVCVPVQGSMTLDLQSRIIDGTRSF